MPRWHFGSPPIPATAVLLSMLALSVPILFIAAAAGEPLRFESLLWLIVLLPGFLLAYYRGWQGVATGLALGMAVFSLMQVYLVVVDARLPDWPLMAAITIAYVAISVALGSVVERLHGQRETAERLALYDALTQLPNRRYLDLILEREFAAAQRGRVVVAVAFDVDGLKEINDRHGHLAGDDALRAVGKVLARNTRTMDLSARPGGDEFVSVLSSSSLDGALVFVHRVFEAVHAIDHIGCALSLSAGIAAYDIAMVEPRDLLEAADRALYRAKHGDGTKVVIADPEEDPTAATRDASARRASPSHTALGSP